MSEKGGPRTCHDCGEQIGRYETRVTVDKPAKSHEQTVYHANCYSDRDQIARMIEGNG